MITPRTWATGEVVTAALLNTELRDALTTGVARALADTGAGGLGAATSAIDMQNIPQTFAALLLLVHGRGDVVAGTTDLRLRINGDTGANYDQQDWNATAAASGAAEAFGGTLAKIGVIPGATAGTSLFGHAALLIANYTDGGDSKIGVSHYASKAGTASTNFTTGQVAWSWRSASPITQLTLMAATGNLAARTRATLIGLPA